jgi:hypothetical protein
MDGFGEKVRKLGPVTGMKAWPSVALHKISSLQSWLNSCQVAASLVDCAFVRPRLVMMTCLDGICCYYVVVCVICVICSAKVLGYR